MSSFTLDDNFYNEILRLSMIYYQQAERCRDNNAFLAGCVMIGAALEALLLAIANCFPEEVVASPSAPRIDAYIKPLANWSLAELIAVAKDCNWLPSTLSLKDEWDAAKAKIGDYAEVVRQIRNLIHPSRYAMDMPCKRITKRYLESSFNILTVVTQHLENKIFESLQSIVESDSI
jgi:hypothetical protein